MIGTSVRRELDEGWMGRKREDAVRGESEGSGVKKNGSQDGSERRMDQRF